MPHCCKLSALNLDCECQQHQMPNDFVPGPNDVICPPQGVRGRLANSHPGNIRFRQIVDSYMDYYAQATTTQKHIFISEILTRVRINSGSESGFVKQKDGGLWYEVGGNLPRQMVLNSLRVSLKAYRSSGRSETVRRATSRSERQAWEKKLAVGVGGISQQKQERKGQMIRNQPILPTNRQRLFLPSTVGAVSSSSKVEKVTTGPSTTTFRHVLLEPNEQIVHILAQQATRGKKRRQQHD